MARELGKWLHSRAARHIPSNQPVLENAFCQGFNGDLRDEYFISEGFDSLNEGQSAIEQWQVEYSTRFPDSVLPYRPPVAETCSPPLAASLVSLPRALM